MAVRTELDAMRARAEAAEAKLAEHAKKAARVDHAEARLEEARRLAREATTREGPIAGGLFAGMLVTAALGGALLRSRARGGARLGRAGLRRTARAADRS